MSYTVNEKDIGHGFGETTDQRSYTRPFQVISTTLSDTDIRSARDATGMPAKGDEHPDDSGSFVSDVSLEELSFGSASTKFLFHVNYTTKQIGGDSTASTSPLNQPPSVGFGTSKYARVMEKGYKAGDTQGNPTKTVENSAGDPFDPPLSRTAVNTIVGIRYNTRTFRGSWVKDFVNTRNASSITVAGVSVPPGQGRINEIGASSNYDQYGNRYWSVVIQIEVADKKFERSAQDRGFNRLYSPGGGSDEKDPFWIETDEGASSQVKGKSEITDFQKKYDGDESGVTVEPVRESVKLNGVGQLYTGDVWDAEYLDFQECFDKEWGTLNIPQTAESNNNSNLGGLADLGGGSGLGGMPQI